MDRRKVDAGMTTRDQTRDRGTAGPVPHDGLAGVSRKSEQIDRYSLLRGHIGETAPPPDTPESDPGRGTGPAGPALDDSDAALAAIVATLHRPRWQQHAACKAHPGLSWHGPPGFARRTTTNAVEAMKAVCHDCPVLDACAAWTTDDRTTDLLPGVLAGRTRAERRQHRRTSRSTDATS
jgi:WhiB family redox-sensing transcriptional regulator